MRWRLLGTARPLWAYFPLYLIGGAFVSIALAWSLGNGSPNEHWDYHATTSLERAGLFLSSKISRTPCSTYVVFGTQRDREAAETGASYSRVLAAQSGELIEEAHSLPGWSLSTLDAWVGRLPPSTRHGGGNVGVFAAGWPCRCVKWVDLYAPKSRLKETSGAWHVRSDVRFPYLPMWGGLLVNSLAYSGCVAALHAAWRLGRRAVRVRRGACPRCAYDRRGLVGGADAKCPECGTVPRS